MMLQNKKFLLSLHHGIDLLVNIIHLLQFFQPITSVVKSSFYQQTIVKVWEVNSSLNRFLCLYRFYLLAVEIYSLVELAFCQHYINR